MSATQKKTPGVYIQEVNAFPNSVVEVETAVPAFIGYTETAMRGTKPLLNVPTRIASLKEYQQFFGGQPPTRVKLTDDGSSVAEVVGNTRFFLYASLRLYFDNGGGPCYIVSVGDYKASKTVSALTEKPLAALSKEMEPTMIVVPDAVLLDAATDSTTVYQLVLQHCNAMQSRIGIFDIFDGDQKRTNDDQDVITGFRALVSDFYNYGVAYYPWLNTNLVEDGDVDYGSLTDDSIDGLKAYLTKRSAATFSGDKLKALQAKISEIAVEPDLKKRLPVHNMLYTVMPDYKTLMLEVKEKLNVLPPSGGIAGVYARIDDAIGVQKAPANTGITSAISPVVDIDHDEQEDLNVPLNGLAVNAIRTLPGRGMRIWGARTLDGNSQDWRYVNVRRTMIMLEQSIKAAAQAYVFEPNNSLTWSTVKSMISNFLLNQWKGGVLMGAKPDDAFSVDVGLGSTMTGDDVLDGYMNVVVKVCVVRPAEFIVITFQQLMPTS